MTEKLKIESGFTALGFRTDIMYEEDSKKNETIIQGGLIPKYPAQLDKIKASEIVKRTIDNLIKHHRNLRAKGL